MGTTKSGDDDGDEEVDGGGNKGGGRQRGQWTMERAARVMVTATKRARARKRARRRVRAICNSVFGAPKFICVEPTQKKRSHIRAVTNHKSQICDCDSQTQMRYGNAPVAPRVE
jgi:hypothetical protein